MPTYIAIFRGINVGGNNILPMKSLAALMAKLGYEDVTTYIQSGNVVFKCDEKSVATIEERIAAAIAKAHKFKPRILILTVSALKNAIKNNPFPEATSNHKSLHLWFLTGPCKAPNIEGLDALKAKNEAYRLDKNVFYFHAPDGIGKSKLAGRVDKLLGVEATARNWQTVTKVFELAQAVG